MRQDYVADDVFISSVRNTPDCVPDTERNIAIRHTTNELVDLIKASPLDFEPGARTSYSNDVYVGVLAYVIERASGMSYLTFLRRTIFELLAMQDTGQLDEQDIVPGLATGCSLGSETALSVDPPIRMASVPVRGTAP